MGQTQSAAGRCRSRNGGGGIIPASKGPRRLAFQLRKRGFRSGSPSLLITNRLGVWSLARRRYVRTTRRHRYLALRGDARPAARAYAALVGELGMFGWAECGGEREAEIRRWRRKLVDMHWDLAPPDARAGIVERLRRQRRMVFFRCAARVIFFLMLGELLIGGAMRRTVFASAWANFAVVVLYVVTVFLHMLT
ncbi:hypothetical protein ACP70R_018453 [Stipagrostis hirtigluma subsp. patula]